MTDDEQLAGSLRYSSAHVWLFAEIRPGLFALYNPGREPVLISERWPDLLLTYQARPVYTPRPAIVHKNPTLASLEIMI